MDLVWIIFLALWLPAGLLGNIIALTRNPVLTWREDWVVLFLAVAGYVNLVAAIAYRLRWRKLFSFIVQYKK